MKQDKKGFLWIGCDAGLVRYDGNAFTLLSNKKNRGPAISGLREDKQGRIWCTNFSGQVFFTDGDSLQVFEPWEKNYHTGFAEVAVDENDFLYISNYQNNIYRYNLATNTEKAIVNNNSTKIIVYTAYDGTVLFTQLDSGKVKRITPNGTATVEKKFENNTTVPYPTLNNFVFYNSFAKKQTLGFQRFNSEDKQPAVYYYTNGVLYLHPVSSLLQQLKAFPTCCFDDDAGNLFIGTFDELLWFKQLEPGHWYLFNRSLQGNTVSFIQQDREGGTWIATLKNGLYKIANKDIWTLPLSSFNINSTGINQLTSDGVSTIFGAAANGEIFALNISNQHGYLIKTNEKRSAQALEFDPYSNQLFISKANTSAWNIDNKTTSDWTNLSSNAKDFYFRSDGVFFISGSGASAIIPVDKKQLKEIGRAHV